MTAMITDVSGDPILKPFRPLLAAQVEDINILEYPLIASPKVDGIRVLCHPTLGPVTRSLKHVPNEHIRRLLSSPEFFGFDGEVTAGEAFQKTASSVMSHGGEPEFKYHVFDYFLSPELPYAARQTLLINQVPSDTSIVQLLEFCTTNSPEELTTYEATCLIRGFEGTMLRRVRGRYKFGRSTLKEQILLKLKRFKDAEATVTGFEPLYSNQNPQTRDQLGLAKRSDHKAGQVQIDTLGALLVHNPEFGGFAVGSGFDSTTRAEIWTNKEQYLGKTITFKYQTTGIKEKPRFPIFKAFRPTE